MPSMNYNLLRNRMYDCGITQKECASRIGMSEGTLSRKLAGEYAFKQDEIMAIGEILGIDGSEIGKYFFSPKS